MTQSILSRKSALLYSDVIDMDVLHNIKMGSKAKNMDDATIPAYFPIGTLRAH